MTDGLGKRQRVCARWDWNHRTEKGLTEYSSAFSGMDLSASGLLNHRRSLPIIGGRRVQQFEVEELKKSRGASYTPDSTPTDYYTGIGVLQRSTWSVVHKSL